MKTEVALEEIRRSGDAVRGHTGRGKLDRERDSVKPLANAGDDRRIRIAKFQAAATCSGPLQEQLHRRKLQRVSGIRVVTGRFQRRQPVGVLAFDPHCLPTGC